jgi:hypothetical protein
MTKFYPKHLIIAAIRWVINPAALLDSNWLKDYSLDLVLAKSLKISADTVRGGAH